MRTQGFRALKDFWSDETGSQYCAGLTYTASWPDADAPCHWTELLPAWEEQGLVEMFDAATVPKVRISGHGIVT
ncbi:MAG TPA: hypothetical protein VMW48_11940 [Vicinamibacterales bacterium]|nr:hypothetical protein [Vicinamibacterales bacterium]